MTSAHASVGAAATCPTTGTIFNPADATLHGAAASPQPVSPAHAASSTASTIRFIGLSPDGVHFVDTGRTFDAASFAR
jgi:hypothetical protein